MEEPGWLSRYNDWLLAGRERGRISSPGSVNNLLHSVQTGSGAHPASYPMDLFPGVKNPGHEADRLLPNSTEVKKT
jgi:hypothetical protein